MYKLDDKKDMVKALFKSGKDYVTTSLRIADAQRIIDNGNLVKSEKSNYPICVNHEWYFEGIEIKNRKKV